MADNAVPLRKHGVEVVALEGDDDDAVAVPLGARLDSAIATGSHLGARQTVGSSCPFASPAPSSPASPKSATVPLTAASATYGANESSDGTTKWITIAPRKDLIAATDEEPANHYEPVRLSQYDVLHRDRPDLNSGLRGI